MTIRRAVASDLADIMALERASFPTDAWSEAMMSEELCSPYGYYIVDELAGRTIGYAGLRAVTGVKDADIQTITVGAAARGRGRGRALLTELLDEAVRRGATSVFLEVRADNPVAEALYVSEGFLSIGRRPRYYQPDGVDAIVMKLDLAGWAHRRGPGAVGTSEEIRTPEEQNDLRAPQNGGSPQNGGAAVAEAPARDHEKSWCT